MLNIAEIRNLPIYRPSRLDLRVTTDTRHPDTNRIFHDRGFGVRLPCGSVRQGWPAGEPESLWEFAAPSRPVRSHVRVVGQSSVVAEKAKKIFSLRAPQAGALDS